MFDPSSILETRLEDMEPVASQDSLLSLVTREILSAKNPYLSKETIVLRNVERIMEDCCNVSFSNAVNTLRTAQCRMDASLHQLVLHVMERNGITDDVPQIDRVLSKDYVKSSDVIKLATVLNKYRGTTDVCKLFAVDGFQGNDDLRRYVDNFKMDREDFKKLHAKAVRNLYDRGVENVNRTLTQILQQSFSDETIEDEIYKTYVDVVGKENLVKIAEWKKKEYEKHLEDVKKECEKNKMKRNKKEMVVVNEESDEEPMAKKMSQ